MRNAGCVPCSSTPAICSTAPAWRPMMPGMMSTQGRVAMDAEAYDRAWRIEQRAEELFKRDYPSGSFARRLPHFRSSYPDPVGDHYRRLAFGHEGAQPSMAPELSSARQRAAAAFNEIASAAKIA